MPQIEICDNLKVNVKFSKRKDMARVMNKKKSLKTARRVQESIIVYFNLYPYDAGYFKPVSGDRGYI